MTMVVHLHKGESEKPLRSVRAGLESILTGTDGVFPKGALGLRLVSLDTPSLRGTFCIPKASPAVWACSQSTKTLSCVLVRPESLLDFFHSVGSACCSNNGKPSPAQIQHPGTVRVPVKQSMDVMSPLCLRA